MENQPPHYHLNWGERHYTSINKLANLNIPNSCIKNLMRIIHKNAIKYLTYLVLNIRKLNNKQAPVPPPQ